MRYAALIGAALLAGFAHDQPPPITAAAPRPPPKPSVYYKEGASNEHFQRARAGCLGRAEIAESGSTDPNPFGRVATWMMVYRTCMRADGWVLVPQ
jgi:hypothetical protein